MDFPGTKDSVSICGVLIIFCRQWASHSYTKTWNACSDISEVLKCTWEPEMEVIHML